MATLYRERDTRARRAREVHIAFYRNELRRSAAARASALAHAEEAQRHVERLLPGALQAGVPVSEAAAITGVSRATLYRMIARANRQQSVEELAAQVQATLALLGEKLDHPPEPADLQEHLGGSVDEVFRLLASLYPFLEARIEELDSVAPTALVDLLPGLTTPEKTALTMLLFHGRSPEQAAQSMSLPELTVLGRAALGLLRLLPDIEARVATVAGADRPA
jgi:DNA-directed RNA polymerase specialized sigma24 family protein